MQIAEFKKNDSINLLAVDDTIWINGWTKDTVGRPIDYIFVNDNFVVNSYAVVTDTGSKTNVSDHYMIEATLHIK